MQLTDGEDLYNTVLHAPIGICILNADTLVAEIVNDKFLEVAGKPYEDIHGKFYWDAFAEARMYYEAALAGVVQTGEPYYANEVELMLIRHGREEMIFVTFVYAPVKDNAGKIKKVAVWVFENTKQVNERQKVEASRIAFQQERDRLKSFFMQAPAGICILDGPDLVYELVNPSYQELLPGRQLLGRPIFEALPELVGTPLQDILLNVYRTGQTYQINEQPVPIAEYEGGPTRDRYFSFTYQARRNEEDKVDGILAFVFEVTGMIEVQQVLRDATDRSEQQKRVYEAITSGTPDLMYVFGLDYRFTYANTALLSMWGKTWDNAVGKSLLENGYEPWHAEMHEREIDRIKATKQPIRGEVSFPHATLGKRIYDYILTPVFNEQGEVEAVAGVTRDVTERKQDEQQLQLLIDMLPASVVVIRGQNLVVEMINQANLEYWNKTAAEVVGRPFLEILPDLADQPFAGQLRQVMATGEVIDVKESPVLFENPDGSIRETFVDYTYQPLTDIGGNRTGVLVMSFEITDRVNARRLLEQYAEELQSLNEEMAASNEELATANEELLEVQQLLQNETTGRQAAIERLETSEHRARSIVAAAPFPIGVYTGREMRILMANQAIIDVWGKGDEVVGKTYHELLPELAGQGIYEQLDTVFMSGKPFHARNQRVDIVVEGKLQPFYFNYSFTPLRDTDGEVYGVMNTAAELTDLVLAKQQVERSEENLKAMIAQAPVAMCILSGPDHVITVANHLMVELWGKPQADVMNKPVFDALPDARGQGLEKVMDDVYQTGETFYASELPVSLIRHGQAEVVYQNFVYQAYRDAAGSIAGVMAITIDVTEQVLSRKTIEQSAAELREIKIRLEAELETSKQVQRQKDGFIGMASHELKTPLTSLTAIIQVANAKLKNSDDSFLASAMDKAGVQVKRMTTMINGFLNVSRLESGKLHIDRQRFDIDLLINDMISEINLTTSSHLIHFAQCPPIPVNADREKIGSVISNLLSNAVKYSPKGKNIQVGCIVQNGEVTVSVADEGMGIKPQDLEKIFERYYRIETDHTLHIAGFGIGLYLSSEIVRRHNGRIWAESESGKGSTFYFSLPLE